jgi:AcrR family transcriptional regulator
VLDGSVLRPRLTRAERREQTRRELLDAAARVFVRRGLQGASVEEISAEAGYSRGAFYSNFSSKAELFVELLNQRVYTTYTAMVEAGLQDPAQTPTLEETGQMLAAIQADSEGRWLFRLWLECLAQADRDPRLRELASGFWRGNRAGTATLIERATGLSPERAKALATAMIALDIGLAIQHFVDPDEVPLELYPELYVWLLSGPLSEASPAPGRRSRR